MEPGFTRFADWNSPHNESCGSWTPDGRYYIFEAVRPGSNNSNLWALREKTGPLGRPSREPVQLTTGPLDFYMPVSSVDGHKLYVIGVQKRGELVRYDAKSGQFRPFLSSIWAEQLDFSRDGRWVAYVLYPEGSLWRSKLDGSERLQLTFAPAQVPHAALVSGRQADRLFGLHARQAQYDLLRLGGWWGAGTVDHRRETRFRSMLVSGWQVYCSCTFASGIGRRPALAIANSGFGDSPGFHSA